MDKRTLQAALINSSIVRSAIAVALLCRGGLSLIQGRLYRGLDDISWIVRASRIGSLKWLAGRFVFRVVRDIKATGRNAVVESYRADGASAALAASYSLNGGPHELMRDLIVLKRATAQEKGVVLLKYVRTFDAVVSMFDLSRLMERYLFVLEPCWAGYCDPSLLMFVAPGQPVIVQCFTQEDYDFVTAVGAPLVPVRLGPADWVDADLFRPRDGEAKRYDLVMVANWAPHKRHAQLFKALRTIQDRSVRVLLIGFPWGGRTADDVRREAAAIGNPRVTVEILEKLPAKEVAGHVSQCKAFVFLSRKEGDNKALVEALFAGVPAIVFDKTIGGAGSRINPSTGVFASDEQLADTIRYMLDHHSEFAPRPWALEHSGSAVATRILDETIRRTLAESGSAHTERIVEKTNSPNLSYKDSSSRAKFQSDYEFILTCRREGRAEAQRVAVA